MLDWTIEPSQDVSWEVRLGTVGRLLDQRMTSLGTMQITVLGQGVILQRPSQFDVALDRLSMVARRRDDPAPARLPLGDLPPVDATLPSESLGVDEPADNEPFIVKRIAPPALNARPSTMPTAIRHRLRALMRDARLAAR
jgi:hypothetical protein